MNKELTDQLQKLGLTYHESLVYCMLLSSGPSSHQDVAVATGINRTKVYRLAAALKKKGIIAEQVDPHGKYLSASDPSTLGVIVTNKEQQFTAAQDAYKAVLPALQETMQDALGAGSQHLTVKTYTGEYGYKQMLWHELKVRDEICIIVIKTIYDFFDDPAWVKKYLKRASEMSHMLRVIVNTDKEVQHFKRIYGDRVSIRLVPNLNLSGETQLVLYNETAATYSHNGKQRVGFEVVDADYAKLQKQLFELYWNVGKPV